MKKLFLIGTALFIVGVLLGLLQLWFALWATEIFLKVELTISGLLAIVVVTWYVLKEYAEDKKTRSGKELDAP